MREDGASPDVICACGPAPMLRALKQYAAEKGIACWLSLEEKMACGVGACLSCVCRSAEVDEHSRVKNKRVCRPESRDNRYRRILGCGGLPARIT